MIYIYTRFCLPIYFHQLWKPLYIKDLNRQKLTTIDDYLSWLYDEKRLDVVMKYLINITYKSLLLQKNKNFKWIICLGKDTPSKYMQIFKNICSDTIFIESFEHCEFIERTNKYPKEKRYSTIRLDSDDGLTSNYIDTISHINNPNIVFGIKSGYITKLIDDNNIYIMNKTFEYLTSPGLGCVNNNIFSLGNHTKLHTKFNILDLSNYGIKFLLSSGDHTVTSRQMYTKIDNEYQIEDIICNKKP